MTAGPEPATGKTTGTVRRALRQALPLFAGQAVVLGAGFALNVALVAWVFPDDPAAMGRLGVLSDALQWITVIALMGMPAAVLRFLPAEPARAGAVARTATAASIAAALALTLCVVFVEPLGKLLAGDAAGHLATYGFRAAPLCGLYVATAALHATGRLGKKAFVEGGERVAVLAFGLFFALRWGFDGLLWGMLAGSLVAWGLAAASVMRRDEDATASFPLADLVNVGAPQMALSLLETMRPLILIRVAQELVDGPALGHFATARTFALPLVIAPELLAQALFPGMHGPGGEGAHVEGDRRRFVRNVALSGAAICIVYGALAAWLLPTIGTGKYAGAVLPLLAFLPGVLAQGATAHTGYVVLVRDRLGAAAVISAVSVAITVGLGFVLLPLEGPAGGAVGAALAMSAGLIARSGMLLVLARRGA